MFKKMIPLGLAIAMLIPTIASADTIPTPANSAKAPYAAQIKAERQTIKTNRDTNQGIRVTIKDKLAQIKTLVTQDKADKTLKAKKDALIAERAVIKADNASRKAINVNLATYWQTVKTDVSNKDYANLVIDLQKIPALQTSKTPILQKLSSDLDALTSILK